MSLSSEVLGGRMACWRALGLGPHTENGHVLPLGSGEALGITPVFFCAERKRTVEKQKLKKLLIDRVAFPTPLPAPHQKIGGD